MSTPTIGLALGSGGCPWAGAYPDAGSLRRVGDTPLDRRRRLDRRHHRCTLLRRDFGKGFLRRHLLSEIKDRARAIGQAGRCACGGYLRHPEGRGQSLHPRWREAPRYLLARGDPGIFRRARDPAPHRHDGFLSPRGRDFRCGTFKTRCSRVTCDSGCGQADTA